MTEKIHIDKLQLLYFLEWKLGEVTLRHILDNEPEADSTANQTCQIINRKMSNTEVKQISDEEHYEISDGELGLDDMFDGELDGELDEVSDEELDGELDDMFDGELDGQLDDMFDGELDETSDGELDETSDGKLDIPDGKMQQISNDVTSPSQQTDLRYILDMKQKTFDGKLDIPDGKMQQISNAVTSQQTDLRYILDMKRKTFDSAHSHRPTDSSRSHRSQSYDPNLPINQLEDYSMANITCQNTDKNMPATQVRHVSDKDCGKIFDKEVDEMSDRNGRLNRKTRKTSNRDIKESVKIPNRDSRHNKRTLTCSKSGKTGHTTRELSSKYDKSSSKSSLAIEGTKYTHRESTSRSFDSRNRCSSRKSSVLHTSSVPCTQIKGISHGGFTSDDDPFCPFDSASRFDVRHNSRNNLNFNYSSESRHKEMFGTNERSVVNISSKNNENTGRRYRKEFSHHSDYYRKDEFKSNIKASKRSFRLNRLDESHHSGYNSPRKGNSSSNNSSNDAHGNENIVHSSTSTCSYNNRFDDAHGNGCHLYPRESNQRKRKHVTPCPYGPSDPKMKKHKHPSYNYKGGNKEESWIIGEIYKSEHKPPEEICLMLVSHLPKLLSTDRPIQDIRCFVKVVNKALSTSLTQSHNYKVLYTLRQQRFFERKDLIGELKDFETKRYLSMTEKDFLTDITDLMSLSVDLVALQTEDNLLCSILLEHILSKHDDGLQPLKDKLSKITELQEELPQSKRDSACIVQFMHESEMYILPTIDIIRSTNPQNIPDPHETGTPFDNEMHYLLYIFCIFREDFIRPLCNGIRRYISFLDENPDRTFKDPDVRLFEGITIQSKRFISGTGIVWVILIPNMHYHPSVLKFGSLLCLSCNGFSNMLYATVAQRDDKSLRQGKICIQFVHCDINSISRLANCTFVMLESRKIFSSHSHCLKRLKDIYIQIEKKTSYLPLKSYVIGHSVKTRAPKYLEFEDRVCFDGLLQYGSGSSSGTDYFGCVTDFNQWPTYEELGFDESQFEALKMALTKEIALIQDPPGTGKTFLGIRIAQFLLENRFLWRNSERNTKPLLLVSYTNHALDQFLCALVETPTLQGVLPSRIVRVGSRCEDTKLLKYNLKEHRRASYTYRDNQRMMKSRIESYDFDKHMIEEYSSGIVHEKTLKPVMLTRHYCQFTSEGIRCPDNESRLLKWLEVNMSVKKTYDGTDKIFWTDDDLFEEDKERMLENSDDLKNEDWKKDFNANRPLMALNEQTLEQDTFCKQMSKTERQQLLTRVINTVNQTDRMSHQEANSVSDIWKIHVRQRWRLYRHWIWCKTKYLIKYVSAAEFELEEEFQLGIEQMNVLDVQIMRNAWIVAMTTTGAAIHSSALQEVSPAVVIVEEAAQVAEQHVISSLSKCCQHLIMIADHQQLRPSFNDFEICKKYKTDVSLFERWIISGMEYKQLKLQHRMRPEISALLKPHIYEHLCDHDSVHRYEDIRGMSTNVFFLDHDHLENHGDWSLSYRNQYEGEMISKLYRHLILQNYSPQDITILSPYKDQVYLLKTMIQDMEKNDEYMSAMFSSQRWKNVRITAVDNYQGEENKIILISLVRSNISKKIGYLSSANRICVILSRAREGLYVFGNMSLLKEKSTLWKKVLSKAEDNKSTGKTLKLKCETHKTDIAIKNPEDFAQSLDGGCGQDCDTRLQCGHACGRKCHTNDKSHNLPCKKSCSRTCQRGHPCQNMCYERCGNCKEKVMVELESCGHRQEILCYQDPTRAECQAPCTVMLRCGHVCQRKCGKECNTPSDCMELIQIDARCGHKIQIACCTQSNPKCPVPCTELLKCGHKCKGTCGKCFRGNLHQECKERCTRVLICGHVCQLKCNVPCGHCTKQCTTQCCHSRCKRECGEICTICIESCDWCCKHGCPNSFKCNETCGALCDRPVCNHPCKRKLGCKHHCAGFFCEPCFCLECQEDDPKQIFFGTEDEPNAVFYQLPDCKHIFESEGLDTYMNQPSDNAIRRKECPKCKSPVVKAQRYNNVIKCAERDIQKVKRNFISTNETLQEKRMLIQEFENIPPKCQQILQRAKNVESLDIVLIYLQNRDVFVSSIKSLRSHISLERVTYVDSDQLQGLMTELENLQEWINGRCIFSDQQVEECQMEIKRIQLLWKMYRIKGRIEKDGCQLDVDDKDKMDAVTSDLEKNKLSNNTSQELGKYITGIEQKYQMFELSKDEKIMIVKAMNFSKKGHWYKCKNGKICFLFAISVLFMIWFVIDYFVNS